MITAVFYKHVTYAFDEEVPVFFFYKKTVDIADGTKSKVKMLNFIRLLETEPVPKGTKLYLWTILGIEHHSLIKQYNSTMFTLRCKISFNPVSGLRPAYLDQN